MSREELEKRILEARYNLVSSKDKETIDILEELAIKALEQESMLDKIRAEIKALSPEPTTYDVVDGNPVKDAIWETLIEVDKIIDKYRKEQE